MMRGREKEKRVEGRRREGQKSRKEQVQAVKQNPSIIAFI